jgi:putative endonuclease
MHDERGYFVYLLASKKYGTLYIGVTGDLISRIAQHKSGEIKGFTSQYNVKVLVWYQEYGAAQEAIQRETNMKRWKRDWKISLIERENPGWLDLYPQLLRPVTQTQIIALANRNNNQI